MHLLTAMTTHNSSLGLLMVGSSREARHTVMVVARMQEEQVEGCN